MAVRLLKFAKPRSFYYHYNKPQSLREGKPMMSVHVDGKCHISAALTCEVKAAMRVRKTQPHVVMAGKCAGVVITDKQITLY